MNIKVTTLNVSQIINKQADKFCLDDHGYVVLDDERFEKMNRDLNDAAKYAWVKVNWSEYCEEKPKEVHSDIMSYGSGVVFEINNKFILTMLFGFKDFDSKEELLTYMEPYKNCPHNEFMNF